MQLQWIGSPNYATGRQGYPIDRIVLHWMDGELASTDVTFQDTTRQTSAHYGIEDGVIHQYVHEGDTAYHARDWDMNLRSIGIEHSADPNRPASDATLNTSAALIADICKRYSIPCDRDHIRRHSEVIATQCPGTLPVDDLVNRANAIIQGGGKTMDYADAKKAIQMVKHRDVPTDDEVKALVGMKPDMALGILLDPEWKGQDWVLKEEYPRINTALQNAQSQISNLTDRLSRANDLPSADSVQLGAIKGAVKVIGQFIKDVIGG